MLARALPSTSAFPVYWAGQLLHRYFRGLLSVYSRYSLPIRGVTYVTLSIRGFSSVVTSAVAPIATGWSEPVPGRDSPPLWIGAFSRRTSKLPLGFGPIAEAILKFVRDRGVNLIVMEVKRLEPVMAAHLPRPDTAYEVVRTAPCPVLTVR